MKSLWQNKNFCGATGRRCRIRTALQAPKASVLPLHYILYKNVLWSGGGGVSPMPRPQIPTAIPYFSFILAPQESAKPIDIIIVKKALTRRLSRRHFLKCFLSDKPTLACGIHTTPIKLHKFTDANPATCFYARQTVLLLSMAQPLGLEPRQIVLETIMLPLHQGHI